MYARKHIVVIGGGTGTHTVLTGLKRYDADLTAIVAMSDNGGSTGVLRHELDVLPPGDVRQCLVALSSSDALMRALMNYRFDSGALKGHNFGNLLLSALEKITGNFGSAVEKVSDVLRIEGTVIPVTLDHVDLVAKVAGRLVKGEESIQTTVFGDRLEQLWLEPVARANPRALRAIRAADIIVLGPGNLYASIVPSLLVRGIPEAIRKSGARTLFVCNLVTKAEHTPGYDVADFVAVLERYLGGSIDAVLYNTARPDAALFARALRDADEFVAGARLPERTLVPGDFLPRQLIVPQKVGVASRESSLVRHDPGKLARAIARVSGITHRRPLGTAASSPRKVRPSRTSLHTETETS